MKNHTYLFLFLCALCYSGLLAQTNQLRVINPDRVWQQAPAQIKDVTLTVDPRGAFFEYGLYLTIEDTESSSSFGNQLEVVFDFGLPAEASVVDSWLWVEGEIIKADLLDRWTANQIYEDIVDRRQDPSILFKQSATQYQLRIFPLNRGSERRVKIAWLQPVQWGNQAAIANLPAQLLNASSVAPNLKLRIFNPAGWANPGLIPAQHQNFTAGNDPLLGGSYLEMPTLSPAQYNENQLRIEAPFEDDLLLTTSTENGINYYQMVYQPQIPTEYIPPNRQLILIDYQQGNSTLDRTDILTELKLNLKQQLRESDEFNIILPQFPFAPISEDWVVATDDNIDALFENLSAGDIPVVSNLPILLERGLQYLIDADAMANVLLITNSSNFTTLASANALFDQIRPLFVAADTRISVSYLIDNPPTAFRVNGRWYYGNEYLYELTARQTDGLFEMPNFHTNPVNLRSDLQQMLALGTNVFAGFDLRTRTTDGFCYNRQELVHGSLLSDHPTFVELGQFVGEPPFEASLLGVLNGQVFEIENVTAVSTQDRQAYRAFVAAGIQANEVLPQTNSMISTIIDQSLAARVLCRYTAFLALEPIQGGVVCEDCVDGASGGDFVGGGGNTSGGNDDEEVVSTDEPFGTSRIKMVASPNPLQDLATIKISTEAGVKSQTAVCRVIDTNGKLLRTFAPLTIVGDQAYELEWDTTDLPAGLYLLQLVTEEGVLTIKVLKL